MNKIAIVILSNNEQPEQHGRFIHALVAVNELKSAGVDFKLVFEGMGVVWLKSLDLKDHPVTQHYGYLYESVADSVMGACNFCTKRFEVRPNVESLKVPLLAPEGDHFSVGELVKQGYQVITF